MSYANPYRTTYRYDEREGEMMKVGDNYFEEAPQNGPAVHGDSLPGGINGMRSHADGRIYDSKSRYARGVRAACCEIIGNENPSVRKQELIGKREIGETIKRAYEEVRQFGGDTSKRARMLGGVGSGE